MRYTGQTAGVIERLTVPDEQGRTVRLTGDLQLDFALNQALSPFALAAIELLDPATFLFANSQFVADLDAVMPEAAAKIFLTYSQPWWQEQLGLQSGRSVSDLPIRQTWTLSADAKIATYADDTVELLRSLPDGARLSVSVQDGADVHQQASFLLTGWNAVRKRIEVACKWPEATEQASSGKR